MKLAIIAIASLLVVGVLAVEGALENELESGIITGSAQANCTELDGCVWLCPPVFDRLNIYCTM